MKKRFLITISILMVILIAVAYFLFDKPQEEKIEEQEEQQLEKQLEKQPEEQKEEEGEKQSEETYSKNYDLSLIRNEEYENKFIEYQDKLEEAIKNYEEGGFLEEERPSVDFFIEKARYAKYLGQIDWAIEILNSVFDYYDRSSTAWNNLAKIYEDKKDYVKANEYYQTIIDTFSENLHWSLYSYMAKNAMLMDKKIKTEEYYIKYQSFGGYDGEIEDYLNTN